MILNSFFIVMGVFSHGHACFILHIPGQKYEAAITLHTLSRPKWPILTRTSILTGSRSLGGGTSRRVPVLM